MRMNDMPWMDVWYSSSVASAYHSGLLLTRNNIQIFCQLALINFPIPIHVYVRPIDRSAGRTLGQREYRDQICQCRHMSTRSNARPMQREMRTIRCSSSLVNLPSPSRSYLLQNALNMCAEHTCTC